MKRRAIHLLVMTAAPFASGATPFHARRTVDTGFAFIKNLKGGIISYTANCILVFWNYRNALQRCKCPICSSLISKLTPETSLALQQDAEVVEALKKVKKYNCLFVGGAYGLVMKVQQLPLLCMAMCRGLLNPNRLRENYVAVRLIALLLTGLYRMCGFEFMHEDFWGVRFAIEIPALVVVLLLCVVGLCRRHLRMPHRGRLVR